MRRSESETWRGMVGSSLRLIIDRLNHLAKEIKQMQTAIDRLKASVTRNTEVVAGVVTLIEGLAKQIRDAADDPVELNAIADQMDSSAEALAKAVADNTPAAPTP